MARRRHCRKSRLQPVFCVTRASTTVGGDPDRMTYDELAAADAIGKDEFDAIVEADADGGRCRP
jgi:hypothetical protein